MATFVKISDKTFDFHDRGRQVVDYIDLFDECHYGADQLYFRGRFPNTTEVANQIERALDPEYKDYGGGNPVAYDKKVDGVKTYAEGIALNRYNVPDKKLWTPFDKNDPYPRKARFAVRFLLRLHFHDDYGYIVVGLPWEKLYKEDGSKNPDYPIKTSYVLNGVKISDLTLLEHWCISRRDCCLFLSALKGDDGEGMSVIDPQVSPEVDKALRDELVVLDETSKIGEETMNLVAFTTQPSDDIYISKENLEN